MFTRETFLFCPIWSRDYCRLNLLRGNVNKYNREIRKNFCGFPLQIIIQEQMFSRLDAFNKRTQLLNKAMDWNIQDERNCLIAREFRERKYFYALKVSRKVVDRWDILNLISLRSFARMWIVIVLRLNLLAQQFLCGSYLFNHFVTKICIKYLKIQESFKTFVAYFVERKFYDALQTQIKKRSQQIKDNCSISRLWPSIHVKLEVIQCCEGDGGWQERNFWVDCSCLSCLGCWNSC